MVCWAEKHSTGTAAFLNPTGISDDIYPYNTITDIKDVWSSDNPEGIYPGLSQSSNPYQRKQSGAGKPISRRIDFWLMDAGFVRLKNITLGYSLPQAWLSKIRLSSIRIYADVQNLYVFTKYKGIDPELDDVNPYPQALVNHLWTECGILI